MATQVLPGTDTGTGVFPPEYQSVWIKQAWADEWEPVPYLFPLKADTSLLHFGSTASLIYEYGYFPVQFGGGYGITLIPLSIQDWYVKIVTHSVWGNAIDFIGVVVDESMAIEGAEAGQQVINCMGLEYILSKRIMAGCYFDGNVFLPVTRTFNKPRHKGPSPLGNRSETIDETSGVCTFSQDGYTWDNLSLADYLLYYFGPAEPDFYITGQTEAMAEIVQTWNFHGMNVLDAVNRLIDRKRGLMARIVLEDEPGADVYIEVISILADPLYTPEITLDANPYKVDLNLDNVHVEPKLNINSAGAYDEIIIRATEPATLTFTAGYTDVLLEENWTEAEETAFKALDEQGRASDAYARVYQSHRIPVDVDWSTFCPKCDTEGNVELTGGQGPYPDSVILRELPWQETTAETDSETEFREMFAVVDNPDAEGEYLFVDRAAAADLPNASVRPSDAELSITVKPSQNHIYALNAWDGPEDSNIDPTFDYTTLGITLQVKTEEMPAIVLPMWQQSGGSPFNKQLLIEVPEVCVWAVAQNTVQDIDDDGLVYYNDGDAAFARNDIERLRAVAGLAWAWYGQQRASMTLTVKNVLQHHVPGELIMTALTGMAWEYIGTPVTRVVRDYERQEQTIQTGFSELDVGVI